MSNFLTSRWLLPLALFFHATLLPTFSIMLAPAGDAKHTGRQIEDSLERGITLQFAEGLKEKLEELYPNIRVILTRFPGETIHPLQNANFANRLSVDFYLSLHCFPETETKPRMFLYYFSYGDEFVTAPPQLCFCPYDQAHRINGKITRTWAKTMAKSLQADEFKRLFFFHGVCGLPFKPLIGIKAPALALEVGLKHKTDWQQYVEPIAKSLEGVIQERNA